MHIARSRESRLSKIMHPVPASRRKSFAQCFLSDTKFMCYSRNSRAACSANYDLNTSGITCKRFACAI